MTEDNRMSKGKGYSMIALFVIGLILLWASISNITLALSGCALMYGAYWIYKTHLKKGGKSISEALKENREAKK